MELTQIAGLVGASIGAGAINAVAGGGTLISFPAAIAVGLSPLAANATNTVALFPGQFASAWGYRREIGRDAKVIRTLLPAAALGGVGGSVLLLLTPQRMFDAIVPVLVLFATGLLLWQSVRAKPASKEQAEWELPRNPLVTHGLQFLVAVYGGYFGAGMGIMLLALYGRIGGRDVNRMNGVKTILSAVINTVACVALLAARAVDFRAGAIMAIGAIAGGFLGASVARKVPAGVVRWVVVGIGVTLTCILAWKQYVRG